jgi:imidazolonepropionase
LVIEDGVVVWVGDSDKVPETDEQQSAEGAAVIPGFVDSHSHMVFGGERSAEFAARMAGQSYAAGGIRSTVAATRAATDSQLRNNLRGLAAEMLGSGITTFETKSGYGLDLATETRSLRIASSYTDEVTFLGAHVVPAEFTDRPDEYVALVTGEMLAAAVGAGAKWIDVFCDRGAFDADQAREILKAGKAAGLLPRIHANQLQAGDGIKVAVELDCASADHCTHLTDADVELLAGSNTVATLLPGAEFSTRSPYPDGGRLLAAGATVALATDCNPGSSFTTSMPFCIAVAVRDMNLTPDQALWASTAGGAKALRRTDVGHLGIGASADFLVLGAPNHFFLAYRPGVDLIDQVWKAGDPQF